MTNIKITLNKSVHHKHSCTDKHFTVNTEIMSSPGEKVILKRTIQWVHNQKLKTRTELQEYCVDDI